MTASERQTRVTQTAMQYLLHHHGPSATVWRSSSWNVDGAFDKAITFAKELEARVESALMPDPNKGEPK